MTRGRKFRYGGLAALAVGSALSGGIGAAVAGATGGGCSDANAQYSYADEVLTARAEPHRAVPHELVREVVLSQREHVCVTADGREYLCGIEVSLVVVRLTPEGSDGTVDLTLLCERGWDNYPNMMGIDTRCASEHFRVNRQIEPGLVDVE